MSDRYTSAEPDTEEAYELRRPPAVSSSARNRAQVVAATWNRENETIAQAAGRIHDGARDLVARANSRVQVFFDFFSYALPRTAQPLIMEIGSGLGYIMEAMGKRFDQEHINGWRINGLDIAEHMMQKAKQRLGGVDARLDFIHYDGITVPEPSDSYDLIYSVASLQHVPKEFVYNLFFETRRLLKPTGFAMIHLPSFRHIAHIKAHGDDWKRYNDAQIFGKRDPWMFFYAEEELNDVLKIGVGFKHVQVARLGTALYTCFSKESPW